jgi:hypothetical protein
MQRRGDSQIHVGVRLRKVAEPVHQPLRGEIGRGAHGEHTRALPLDQILRAEGDAVERVSYDYQVVAAGLREDQPLTLAIEQFQAEDLFKRLDLVADGALRHAKLGGGARKAFVPRGGFKGLERVERRQLARHFGTS